MSYTPPDQEMEPALDNTMCAIEALGDVLLARIRNDDHDWKTEHIQECHNMLCRLTQLGIDLRALSG